MRRRGARLVVVADRSSQYPVMTYPDSCGTPAGGCTAVVPRCAGTGNTRTPSPDTRSSAATTSPPSRVVFRLFGSLDIYPIGVHGKGMVCSRNLLSIGLAGLMVFTSSVCACADGAAGIPDSEPHAHHQMPGSHEAPENALCPHADCDDCDSLAETSSDREAKTGSFSKRDLDHDVVWIDLATVDDRLHVPNLARAGPTLPGPLRQTDTPVRRSDILLQ